eukprot:scaffold325821_cov66-Tisochrysis_lutea.AAC.1
MEAGIDSLGATEAARNISELTGVQLAPTLMFDQPSVRDISAHVLELLYGDGSLLPQAARQPPINQSPPSAFSKVRVCSIVSRWPGGDDIELVLWRRLETSGDAVGQVPASRWSSIVQDEASGNGWPDAALHGGFIVGTELFDNRTFGVSPAEATAMDPQQRMVLEYGYTAMHSAGETRASLLGSNTAFILGIERPDWARLREWSPALPRVSAYAATSDTISVACGRVSFALGLHGPCAS